MTSGATGGGGPKITRPSGVRFSAPPAAAAGRPRAAGACCASTADGRNPDSDAETTSIAIWMRMCRGTSRYSGQRIGHDGIGRDDGHELSAASTLEGEGIGVASPFKFRHPQLFPVAQ